MTTHDSGDRTRHTPAMADDRRRFGRTTLGAFVSACVLGSVLTLAATATPVGAVHGCVEQVLWYDYGGGIRLANADGTGNVNVPTTGGAPGGFSSSSWAADGETFAWAGRPSGSQEIYVGKPDGSPALEISSVGGGDDPTENLEPAISPDGELIAWTGIDPASGEREVFLADIDGTNRRVISRDKNYVPIIGDPGRSDPINNRSPAWNTSSNLIVWHGQTSTGKLNIFRSNLVAGSIQKIVDADDARFPTYAPDGSGRLAWQSRRSGLTVAFDVVVDGNRITSGQASATYPVWSPSGDRIAWTGKTQSGPLDVFHSKPDGTDVVSLDTIDHDDISQGSAATWSPDGDHLAFTAFGGPGFLTDRIWVVDRDGANPRMISQSSKDSQAPIWRPLPASCEDDDDDACPMPSNPFTDVSTSSFAYVDILCLYGLDITTGTSPTTYGPDQFVTREQMAAFLGRLLRALGVSCPTPANPFNDVSSSSFAYADILCILGLDITTGTSGTTYSPDSFVTREQMAAFIGRVWRLLGGTCPSPANPFGDVFSSSFAYADVLCIFGLDITTGTSGTTYSPANFVTREQMAAFLARLWRAASG
ncbi:MAG: hypothetical protein DHS20C19_12770 [Acidimicrobiales bacterium]|nr:MAG: hypothetical protein DHS20C19_12770 [Acidimicrobiales bacterium]